MISFYPFLLSILVVSERLYEVVLHRESACDSLNFGATKYG